MSDPAAETINVSDLIEGTYVFELSVTNSNGLNSTDRITVTVFRCCDLRGFSKWNPSVLLAE